MIEPSLQQVQSIAQNTDDKTVTLSMEILADSRTPIELMRILKNVSSHVFMLESVADHDRWGRYTFIGYDPKLEITCRNGDMKIGDVHIKTDNPKQYLEQILQTYKCSPRAGLPSFSGGLVGYFSYDYLQYAEPVLKTDLEDENEFQDLDLMLFDKVIAYDNFRQKMILMVNISLEELPASYNKAVKELEGMKDLIENGTPAKIEPGKLQGELTPLFDKESYCSMVEKAKQHIFDGDIFQVVLSNRLNAPYSGSLFNVYRMLRTINPSPYMFYFSSNNLEVAGASPETLVKLEYGELHTFPLAGTRPRGKSQEEDERLEKELLADPKELAEHNMLVDLGRNDLGRISKLGSVEVEKYMEILRFSHVMHIGSTVKSRIREDKNALDALDAVLPAGTLSGAPKIRAMQIIHDLEQNKRGIYGGAIGYLDFSGNMDTCIAIRLAYRKNDQVFIRSGAGIVADSVPEKEYQECLNKAAAVASAIQKAQEELS
jgi:anthranilate synthase component 1